MGAARREREDRARQEVQKRAKKGAPKGRTPSPASAGRAHLAAGAASPSQFGPSPRPRGLSCRQSSCRLRACKRLQQTRGGGGEESPEGPLVRLRPSPAASPPPGSPSTHSHTCTHTHTHTPTPTRQPGNCQPDPSLPKQGGDCSIGSCSSPPVATGGQTTPPPPPAPPPPTASQPAPPPP